MPKRKQEEDYVELADELGWQWEGPYRQSVLEPTWWICANGHRIERSYKRAKERGCVYCNQHWAKEAADYAMLAELHGIQPPSPLPPSTRDLATWTLGNTRVVTTFRNLALRAFRVSDGEPVDEAQKKYILGRGDLKPHRGQRHIPSVSRGQRRVYSAPQGVERSVARNYGGA